MLLRKFDNLNHAVVCDFKLNTQIQVYYPSLYSIVKIKHAERSTNNVV